MTESKEDFVTEDLATASYLRMKEIELTNYEKRGNKIRFSFADDNGVCKKLHIEFLNSECKRFDSNVRDLKKLL